MSKQDESNGRLREEMWKTKDLCRFLKISVSTAERWRLKGEGPPFIKMGAGEKAAVRYARSEVEKFCTLRQRTHSDETN